MGLKPAMHKLTLYQLFKAASALYKDSPAQYFKVDNEYQSITFTEMAKEVEQIAAGLLALKVKKGDKIGVIADVGPIWLRISFAITGMGAVDVPRGTDATRDDMKYIFSHAECKIVFIENSEVYNKLKPVLKNLPKLKKIIFIHSPEKMPKKAGITFYTLEDLKKKATDKLIKEFHKKGESLANEDLATIIYTSGTTGNPKGVMLTHQNLAWEASSAANYMDLGTGDVTMGYLPPWHIAERLMETSAYYTGYAIAFTSVQALNKDLATIRPTFLVSVPRVWEAMYSKIMDGVKKAPAIKRILFFSFASVAEKFSIFKDILLGTKYSLKKENFFLQAIKKIFAFFALVVLLIPNLLGQLLLGKIKKVLGGRVRFAVSGAGALPEHIDRFFYSVGIPIIEVYGMTETSGISTFRDLKHPSIGTVGKPFDGVEIKLVAEDGSIVTEPGVKGVAWHKGKHIMQGYYKDPKKTKETLVDGWLNSGDLMMWTAQGNLKFAGRAKDTIVLLGGENLEPEPIENMLKSTGIITQVVVVGQDKKTLGALIVPNFERVSLWYQENFEKDPPDPKQWNEEKEIQRLFKDTIKEYISEKNGFKTFERITTFRLLPKEFQVGEE
ncbi:MAG: long-chain fatty acid--CoA ligase, partial [Candidatus Hydrogenedentota bacterium]